MSETLTYKLNIIGGIYSAVDVVESISQNNPSVINDDREYKLTDAAMHTTPAGQMLAEIVIETNREFTEEDALNLGQQFLGIGFKFEKVEA